MTTTASAPARTLRLTERGPAGPGTRSDEVVLGISPAFRDFFSRTIVQVPHVEVLRQLLAGVEEQGARVRVVRSRGNADLAAIAHNAARLFRKRCSAPASQPVACSGARAWFPYSEKS